MRSTIIAVLLVFVPAVRAQKSPTLAETVSWMHNFADDRGSGANFSGSGCSGVVTWYKTSSKTPDNVQFTFSFSFKDLDPNSVHSVHTIISPPADRNMWRATATTTNNEKKVDVFNYITQQHEQDDVIEGIPFYSGEDAIRFAKALRRAVTLCGGKSSTF
jgi:hypothetical protein